MSYVSYWGVWAENCLLFDINYKRLWNCWVGLDSSKIWWLWRSSYCFIVHHSHTSASLPERNWALSGKAQERKRLWSLFMLTENLQALRDISFWKSIYNNKSTTVWPKWIIYSLYMKDNRKIFKFNWISFY